MKKILIFSTAYFPHIGGAEIAVKEITDRISEAHFHMLTARLDKSLPAIERIGNITVHRVGFGCEKISKLWLAFFGHVYAQRLHKREKFDLAWSIMAATHSGLAALRFREANPDVKLLLTLQEGDDVDYIEKRMGLMRGRFVKLFKSADRIQAISTFLVSWARGYGAACPMEVVPNGVDLDNFELRITSYELSGLKQKLQIQDKDRVIITTSRLAVKNGVEYLIRAIKELDSRGRKDIRLLICGTGELDHQLKKLAESLGLESRVSFLGHVSHDDLPKYFAISDLFCRPSLSEGLGNSFLEAMAFGLPVIGTPVGGIVDFLRDKETGFICQPKDPLSIADQIEYIIDLRNSELVDKIRSQAKRLVESEYAWPSIAQKMLKLFNSI